jgi:hypothetical protein
MNLNHSTRQSFQGIVSIAFIYFSTAIAANSATAAVSSKVAIKAIQQRICFEEFWWGRDNFQFGKTAHITFRTEGDTAYVWSEDLVVVSGASRWANFFTVVSKGDQVVVGYSNGYNLDSTRGTLDFEKNREKVFGGEVQTAQLREPTDCTPHFAGVTPEKERILMTIEKTMTNELTLFNKSGGANYPKQVTIIIANFNWDYPETQVFVPSTEQVFHVALRNAADPLSDTYLRQGEYPVGLEGNQQNVKVVRDKIVKYGIDRQVTLVDRAQ